MGEVSLVEKVREIVDSIKSERGPLNLFMLLGDLDSAIAAGNDQLMVDSFTVVVSANWLDELSPREGTGLIIDYLFDKLTEEEISFFSKITAVNTQDPSVINITRNVRVEGGINWNYGCEFGGVYIPFAIIFESKYFPLKY